jgi:hypothetical protein
MKWKLPKEYLIDQFYYIWVWIYSKDGKIYYAMNTETDDNVRTPYASSWVYASAVYPEEVESYKEMKTKDIIFMYERKRNLPYPNHPGEEIFNELIKKKGVCL